MTILSSLDALDTLFVFLAFLIQAVLIIHFAVRRWAFAAATRYGFLVYALAIPALALSVAQMAGGKPWYLWLSGCLFAVWALFGYLIEYVRRIDWRSGGHWTVFALYVSLYLATVMFYWWPLATLARPLWYAYGFLFVVSTLLNIGSHHAGRPALR